MSFDIFNDPLLWLVGRSIQLRPQAFCSGPLETLPGNLRCTERSQTNTCLSVSLGSYSSGEDSMAAISFSSIVTAALSSRMLRCYRYMVNTVLLPVGVSRSDRRLMWFRLNFSQQAADSFWALPLPTPLIQIKGWTGIEWTSPLICFGLNAALTNKCSICTINNMYTNNL